MPDTTATTVASPMRRLPMKTAHRALALVTLLWTATAHAQSPDLPRPSPTASVTQRVGLTDVTVEYSSPGVKGRTIWGELVPYDELWRLGANAATKITFSKDVKVGGQAVPAGSYSLFAVPTKADWTWVLSKQVGLGGTQGYDKAQDQARVPGKTAQIPKRERMSFVFADTTDDATSLDLEWDTLRVTLPITADTAAHAAASVATATKDAARTQANAARWLLDGGKELDRALELSTASVAVDPTWYGLWIHAQILAKKGQKKEALAAAQRAYDLGKKAEYFFWEDQVKKALEEWK